MLNDLRRKYSMAVEFWKTNRIKKQNNKYHDINTVIEQKLFLKLSYIFVQFEFKSIRTAMTDIFYLPVFWFILNTVPFLYSDLHVSFLYKRIIFEL